MKPVTAFAPSTLPCGKAPVSTPLCMAANPLNEDHLNRRNLIKKASVATSAAFFGAYVNFDSHSPNCQCVECGGADSHEQGCNCGNCSSLSGHSFGCQCGRCMSFGPLAANAYERDVGDNTRSATTYALNLQARETNARLEKSGFKLDSKEEEQAKLNSAFASFSYDDATAKTPKSAGKGYGNKNSSTSK